MYQKLFLVLLLAFVISACNTTPPIQETTTELTVAIIGQGKVTSNPSGIDCTETCSESFDEGTRVTLKATPAAGYRFSGWEGQGCEASSTCKFTLEGNTASVTATFEVDTTQQTTELTVTIEGQGQVASSPAGLDCTVTCSESFASGTQLTLTATPAAGYRFDGWEGQGCAAVTSCTFNLQGTAASVLARFEAVTTSTLDVIDDSYTVFVGTTLYAGGARPATGVGPELDSILANDTDVAEISTSTASSIGVTLSAAGNFIYEATTVGVESFSYTAEDAAGNTATATVTITSIPANPAYPESRVKVLNPSMNPLNMSISGTLNYPGDVFYMIPGTYYSTGFNLKPAQQLIGSGVEFVLDGVSLAPKSTRPTLTQYDGYPYALVRITNDVRLSGFNIDVQDFAPSIAHPTPQERHGISVSEFDAVTGGDIVVEELEVRNTSMVGINLGAFGDADSVTLRNVTVTNPGRLDTLEAEQGHGIILSNGTTNALDNVTVTGEKAGFEKIRYFN